jgi:ribose transport system substrate-binding protein
MTRPRRGVLVTIGAAALLGLVACGGDDDSDAGSASSGEAKPVKVALLLPATSTSYYNAQSEAVKEKAEQSGASADVLEANYDPRKQLSQCEDAIASQQYDAIVVYPVDGGAIVPCVRSAVDADVPIVGMGGPLGPDWETLEPQVEGATGYAFPLAQTSGKRLADLAELACEDRNPCKLLYEIGNPAFGYDSTLLSNFKKNLPDHLEIVAQVQTNFNPDDGRTKTTDALQADPDIDVVVTEDTTSQGVIPAIESAGVTGVNVIAQGGSEYATAQVKAGKLVGTVPFYPRSSALLTTGWAIKAARGEKITGDVSVDEATLGDVELVTKDTVDEWTPEFK